METNAVLGSRAGQYLALVQTFFTARFNNRHLAEEQAESRQQYDRAMKSELSLSGRKSEPFWPVQVNPSAMMDK